MTGRSSCKHCFGVIIPCPTPSEFCKGWVHADFLASMPIGAHYCGGRSVNPMAEPGELAQFAGESLELAEMHLRAAGGTWPEP